MEQATGARGEAATRKLRRLEQERGRLEAELAAARRQIDDQRVAFRRAVDDLDNLLASTQVATIFFDEQLLVTRFTPAVTEIIELHDRDLGREIGELDTGVLYPGLAADARMVLASGESVERPVETADGRSFLVRLLPYRTEHAAVNGVIATFFDVTSLELVQRGFEAAQREAADYKYALERSSILAIIDDDGRILHANRHFCEIAGFRRDELLGQSVEVLDSGHHPPEFFEEMWATIRAGDVWRGEVLNRTRAGRLYWIESTIVPLYGDAGAPERYLSISRDVTEKRAAAEKLRAQAGLARLGEMAAVVAHEVRNPIAGIGSALRIIHDRLPAGPESAIIGEIQQRLRLLNDTVEDLLQYARPIEPALRPVALEALLRETADLVAGDGAFADLVIDLDCPAEATVLADPGMLQSLFSNLMLNAAQAMQGTGSVRVTARCLRDRCEARVVDQGPGIPSELRDKVMEPFFTTRSQGTGLGLAIARRIAEAHGGALECEPSSVGGTVMRVELPLAVR